MSLAITGNSTVSKEAFKKVLLNRNSLAPLEVLDHYYEKEASWGVRADVLIAQMLHETDFLRSWWSQPPRRNMAGIGVTGAAQTANPSSNAWALRSENSTWYAGYSFGDWFAAVEAHFAHMSAYVWPDERNNASQKDPRYGAARQAFAQHHWAYCRVLTDLNGRWAVPGTTYGQMIEAILNIAAKLPEAIISVTPTPPAAMPTKPTQIQTGQPQVLESFTSTPSPFPPVDLSLGQPGVAASLPPTPITILPDKPDPVPSPPVEQS